MGTRRLTGVLAQTVLGDGVEQVPTETPPTDPTLPPTSETPILTVYPATPSSGTALRERQFRWFEERDRRRARLPEPAAQPAPEERRAPSG